MTTVNHQALSVAVKKKKRFILFFYVVSSDPHALTVNADRCVCVFVCSWSAALDEPRVKTDVSDVMSVQQPGEETLQTQTITTVRTRAVLSLKKDKRGGGGQRKREAEREKQIMISSLLQTREPGFSNLGPGDLLWPTDLRHLPQDVLEFCFQRSCYTKTTVSNSYMGFLCIKKTVMRPVRPCSGTLRPLHQTQTGH